MVAVVGNRPSGLGDGGMMSKEVELWRRDPVECVRELIGNPAFREVISYLNVHMQIVLGRIGFGTRCGRQTGGGIHRYEIFPMFRDSPHVVYSFRRRLKLELLHLSSNSSRRAGALGE
jgi:Plavaka transposase